MISNSESSVENTNYWKGLKMALELASKHPWLTTAFTVSSLIGVGFFAYNYGDRILKNGLHLTLWNGKTVGIGPTPTVGHFGPRASEGEAEIEGRVDIKAIPHGDSAFDHGKGNKTVIKKDGYMSIGGPSSG